MGSNKTHLQARFGLQLPMCKAQVLLYCEYLILSALLPSLYAWELREQSPLAWILGALCLGWNA